MPQSGTPPPGAGHASQDAGAACRSLIGLARMVTSREEKTAAKREVEVFIFGLGWNG